MAISQKENFRANCICRGGRAAVKSPNCCVPRMVALFPFCGPLSANRKLVWFGRLKNSARNSRSVLSEVWKNLNTEKSQLLYPGASIVLRPTSPNEPKGGSANAQVLNHEVGV